MSSAGPVSYANLLVAVQSTLSIGLKGYNFRDGVFASQLTATDTLINILQTLISSPFLSDAEKNKLRPLLSTLVLVAPTEFITRRHEIYDKLAGLILRPDGTPGHVLKAVQTLFEEDAQQRGLLDMPTTVQATHLEMGMAMFTHAVSAKMNLTVLPQSPAKQNGRENMSLGALPQFQASDLARAKNLGTIIPEGNFGGQQKLG
jgi:hypothetical protein